MTLSLKKKHQKEELLQSEPLTGCLLGLGLELKLLCVLTAQEGTVRSEQTPFPRLQVRKLRFGRL